MKSENLGDQEHNGLNRKSHTLMPRDKSLYFSHPHSVPSSSRWCVVCGVQATRSKKRELVSGGEKKQLEISGAPSRFF